MRSPPLASSGIYAFLEAAGCTIYLKASKGSGVMAAGPKAGADPVYKVINGQGGISNAGWRVRYGHGALQQLSAAPGRRCIRALQGIQPQRQPCSLGPSSNW